MLRDRAVNCHLHEHAGNVFLAAYRWPWSNSHYIYRVRCFAWFEPPCKHYKCCLYSITITRTWWKQAVINKPVEIRFLRPSPSFVRPSPSVCPSSVCPSARRPSVCPSFVRPSVRLRPSSVRRPSPSFVRPSSVRLRPSVRHPSVHPPVVRPSVRLFMSYV